MNPEKSEPMNIPADSIRPVQPATRKDRRAQRRIRKLIKKTYTEKLDKAVRENGWPWPRRPWYRRWF